MENHHDAQDKIDKVSGLNDSSSLALIWLSRPSGLFYTNARLIVFNQQSVEPDDDDDTRHVLYMFFLKFSTNLLVHVLAWPILLSLLGGVFLSSMHIA